ncbi:hypothetical protein [Helicobacter cappadocius]|uniref:Uncharacterized protein n=1 Tax=Helicobacter cappadocius TaxID=3063998 RepID=A0AA90PT15_9HELI|nr:MULTISPECIES: hypothetical protein [unclassified Helicobacter]MDO7252313.1 hypothetical protein [Helicobacter sp. faydin-H75]MDP2538180.1 hypothetical protein [Helicobacter sp. faydin-H76]
MAIFNFSKFVRRFFSNVFIGINIDGRVCSVKIIRIKDEKILENIAREFKTINNEIPIEVIKLIRNYQKKYSFCYVGAMSKSYNQGILRIKDKKEDYSKYGINPKECKMLDFKTWKTYIKNTEINENIERFSKINGIDYLFSPFVVIFRKIKNQLDGKTRLYILQERSSISLLVADNAEIYFGGYFMVEGEMEDVNMQDPHTEDFFDIIVPEDEKDSNEEDIEDEIGDLEDLDSDFFIDKLNEKLLIDNQEENLTKGKVDDIYKISVVTSIIQNSLMEFYSNDLYDSKFIEEFVILDAYGMSDGALNYLKDKMMIQTQKISFSIVDELVELSKIEFKRTEK